MASTQLPPIEKAFDESAQRLLETPDSDLKGILCTDDHGRPLHNSGSFSDNSAAVISQLIQASILIHPNLRPPIITLVGQQSRVVCACNRNIFVAVHRDVPASESVSDVSPTGSDNGDVPDGSE
uniref:Late endosomal/lysosomal adaptor and MAPK and MTOR activator 5 n=1 Tax=Panagrellus redivivus TaxID=6233 RepID=A0A7E4V8T9_PANRE